jgi:hypothetical protein
VISLKTWGAFDLRSVWLWVFRSFSFYWKMPKMKKKWCFGNWQWSLGAFLLLFACRYFANGIIDGNWMYDFVVLPNVKVLHFLISLLYFFWISTIAASRNGRYLSTDSNKVDEPFKVEEAETVNVPPPSTEKVCWIMNHSWRFWYLLVYCFVYFDWYASQCSCLYWVEMDLLVLISAKKL